MTKRRQSRNWLLFADSHLTLGEGRAMRSFYLACSPRVPLFRALLDVLPVENEVIPVNTATFENCHTFSFSRAVQGASLYPRISLRLAPQAHLLLDVLKPGLKRRLFLPRKSLVPALSCLSVSSALAEPQCIRLRFLTTFRQ